MGDIVHFGSMFKNSLAHPHVVQNVIKNSEKITIFLIIAPTNIKYRLMPHADDRSQARIQRGAQGAHAHPFLRQIL